MSIRSESFHYFLESSSFSVQPLLSYQAPPTPATSIMRKSKLVNDILFANDDSIVLTSLSFNSLFDKSIAASAVKMEQSS